MMRAVSLLKLADESILAEIERSIPIRGHLGERHPEGWEVGPEFERAVLPEMQQRGIPVLVRYARQPKESPEASAEIAERIARLSPRARTLLYCAQRHAIGELFVGRHAWDALTDAPVVRELLSSALIAPGAPDGATELSRSEGLEGRMLLHPDLPKPPEIPYDLSDAAMPEPDDLAPRGPSLLALLHDIASLAAAIEAIGPKQTLAGSLAVTDAKRMRERLCVSGQGSIEHDARWGQAYRALQALSGCTIDPSTRRLVLDLGVEQTLSGSSEDAIDHIVHRLVDADQHSALPAVRAALRIAGSGAIDEVIFEDLLFSQHREILFSPWRRGSVPTYPSDGETDPRPFDRQGFDEIEVPLLQKMLARMQRLGVIRRAPGVFAGTEDGRRWAGADVPSVSAPPPMWVGSDLEILVPPFAITPWERLQIERLSKPLSRDTVDRYRIDRASVAGWLRHHDIDEAVALLRRRCPALPDAVLRALNDFAREASRITLTRGVLI